MDLESSLDLLWSESLSQTILSNDSNARLRGVIPHLLGELCVLLHLLFSVPKPLVHLILFQAQLLREVIDLLTTWGLAVKPLVKFPQGVFLTLRFTGSIGLYLGVL